MEELLLWIKYIELRNGPPSHDTAGYENDRPRDSAAVVWEMAELLSWNEGEVLKKLICNDWKNMGVIKRRRKAVPYRVSLE